MTNVVVRVIRAAKLAGFLALALAARMTRTTTFVIPLPPWLRR